MEVQKEYWATLKYKYEEKNQTLEQKEQELRARLEALEKIISQSGKSKKQQLCAESLQDDPTFNINNVFTESGGDAEEAAANPEERCTPIEEKGGFLKCICSILPMGKGKNPPAPLEIPTKDEKVHFNSNQNQEPQSQQLQQSCGVSTCKNRNVAMNSYQVDKKSITTEDACRGLCDFSQPKKTGSSGSLKSIDLFYMQNIQSLAEKQKALVTQINDLDNKTRIYESVLKQYRNVDFSKDDSNCPCAQDQIKNDEADKRSNAELKLENFLLKNELKDMRLDIRQYLEKMEGPIQFKIESEKFKNHQLEQKLIEAQSELAKTRTCYEEEICRLKIQICNATSKINKLTKCNQKLCQDLKTCQANCAKLEEEIIRMKISEAETLKRLKACIEAQSAEPVASECNLYEIARELSKLIRECEPCGECAKLPDDLTQAAKLLKSLTDLVDQKFQKDDDRLGECLASCGGEKTSNKGMRTPVNTPTKLSPTKLPSDARKPSPTECGDICGQQINYVREAPKPAPAPIITPPPVIGIDCKCEEPPVVQTVDRSCSCEAPVQQTFAADTISYGCECSIPPLENIYPPINIEPLSDGCACVSVTSPMTFAPPPIGNSCSCGGAEPIKEFIPAASYNRIECSCSVYEEMKKAAAEQPDLGCSCEDKDIAEGSPPAPVQPAQQPIVQIDDSCVCPLDEKDAAQEGDKQVDVEKLYPTTSERLKLSHQVTASRSKDILKSATSVKCVKVNDNFPYDIDTRVDVIDKPPDGIHVSTTITKSGCLEVVTEGPEGVIETTLVYTNSGNVEVVTEILEYSKKGAKCNIGKIMAGSCKPPGGKVPFEKCLEAPKLETSPNPEFDDCDCSDACPTVDEDSSPKEGNLPDENQSEHLHNKTLSFGAILKTAEEEKTENS